MLETSVCSHKLLWALAYLSKLHEALEEVDQQVVGFVGLVCVGVKTADLG